MTSDLGVRVATDSKLLRRSCESLLGIAAGLIADGELNDREIHFLSTWLAAHPEIATSWPGEVIYKRIGAVLADGVITPGECEYLKKTLTELIGGDFSDDGAIPGESSSLPLDLAAKVLIPNSLFCFTGSFLYGTRNACEKAIETRGGFVGGVNRKLNYLVVGELSSREWKFSSFGTKIEAAMRLKSEGCDLLVVGESQWVQAL